MYIIIQVTKPFGITQHGKPTWSETACPQQTLLFSIQELNMSLAQHNHSSIV